MGDNLPFIDLGAGRTVKKYSVGIYHTCAILDNDELKCWGAGSFGELGYGTVIHRGDGPNEMGDSLPAVNLGTGRKAVEIYAGYASNCALLDNAQLKCWGADSQGELGQNNILTKGSAPGQMGDLLLHIQFGTSEKVAKLFGGSAHSYVQFGNGKVRGWGFNGDGRLGFGDSVNRGDSAAYPVAGTAYVDFGTGLTLVSVQARVHFAYAHLKQGETDKVKCWGQNGGGELGLGETESRSDSPDEKIEALPFLDLIL